MKRFIAVLSGLLVLPAFAEVAPVYYDEVVEYTDDLIDEYDEVEEPVAQAVSQKATPSKRTSTRSTSRVGATSQHNVAPTRTTSPRNTQASSRATASRSATRPTASRVQKQTSRVATVSSRTSQKTKPVTARVSTTGSVMTGNRVTSTYGQATLGDSGESLYNANQARVGVARRSTARASASIASAATTPVVTEEDVSSTTSNLTAIAELTEYCKAQYASCMDNYCNVLDDNQGRCSCSKNIKSYAATEAALTEATENFQDVVQKIKYIGLTTTQINSLFDETEAEATMRSASDKSALRNSLDKIKDKILVDASSPNASSYTSSSVSIDLSGLINADYTSGFDLNSFLGSGASGTSSVSNQRGEQLYKTATARCKTAVLNSCTAQGIDANVITNSYDLEIDKQCIAYERSLNEANTEMRTNARNAANVLQQARLMLAQNKNSYDLRGCIAAVDACMQDEYVCGDDYELCLDPTGKYLANGAIVKGGTPGISGGKPRSNPEQGTIVQMGGPESENLNSGGMYGLYSTWDYELNNKKLNAFGGGISENLNDYVDQSLASWKGGKYKSTTAVSNIAEYLLQKIGYIDSDDNKTVHGMCASAMKQCQNYTFSSDKYKVDNEVVRQYLASALTKIKLKQDTILAEYAEDCRSDVSSCLTTNGYDETNTETTASRTAVNACRAEISTCMSVGGYAPVDSSKLTLRNMSDWVATMLLTCEAGYYLHDDGTNNSVKCEKCPVVSEYGYDTNGRTILAGVVHTVSSGGQVSYCHCPDEYEEYQQGTNSVQGMPKNTNSCIKTEE